MIIIPHPFSASAPPDEEGGAAGGGGGGYLTARSDSLTNKLKN
jgi:hypothetical protein